ncbi:hypothetical protein [Streptomyces sp. A1547]|uniref:hypothetical protein n=1 Tax=Streptomyces sp. A1547 TaxID=2563105 RepID=UPI00109EA387|nr:hypothetical protein [Streptomyces sp. A1547]THA28461.1 hypothetical protein E6W17_40940 [Streptomyces sp. A1547]
MRDLIALPVFYVVSRAPQIAAFLVGSGLVLLFTQTGMPIASGLTVLAIALLGALAVGLACTLPLLTMANGGRRAVRDACWEAAEDVADWAGWETGPPNP